MVRSFASQILSQLIVTLLQQDYLCVCVANLIEIISQVRSSGVGFQSAPEDSDLLCF